MKKLISILLTLTMVLTTSVPALAAETSSTVSLKTDKTEYEYGEDIVVTAVGGTSTAWVGIYNKGDKPGNGTGEVASIFWYYSNNNGNKGKSIVIQGKGTTNGTLSAGDYEIHLFDDSGYNVIKTVEITITGGNEDGDDPESGDSTDEELTNCKLISISYDLDNETDGLANGTVTITADSSAVSGADCIMYWADENGEPLEDYTPLAKFRLTGTETTHEMYDYTIIPEGAKTLIAQMSNKGTVIGDAVSTELPEGCNYIIEDDYNVEFQLISDIHIQESDGKHNTHFTQMLEDVRVNSPESIGIFVNGDIADNGRQAQYEKLISLYNAVKAKGRVPELHIAIGNHDWYNGNPDNQFQKYANKLNPAVETETVYYDETVAGYHFIYLGGEANNLHAVLSEKQLTWFDNRMQEITAEDPEKPVFVLLHQPLYDTVAGTLPGHGWDGVADEDSLKNILKKYDQIIIAGGHSHWELDSERNMYPGDESMSVAVNTASVAYLWTSYNTSGGEEAPGSHGYFVRVYDDKVLFLGRDIENSRFVSSGMFVVEKNPINTSEEEYTIDLENTLVDMKAKAAGGGKLTFESSDTDVVSVIEDGVLRAKKEGTATITISAPATDRYVKNSEQIKVTVVEKLQEEDPGDEPDDPTDPPVDPPEDQPNQPSHVHKHVEFVTAATCTSKGYTTCKCDCGNTYTAKEVSALEHDWNNGEVIAEATCTKDGKKLFTCEREGCSAAKVETIAKDSNNHSYIAIITDAACTTKGYTTHVCACGDSYRTGEVGATGHEFGAYNVETTATFEEEGIKIAKCQNEGCDAKDKKAIPKVMKPEVLPDAYTFNNKNKTPDVKVQDSEGNTVPSQAKFAKSTRKAVGKYYVTVDLLGREHEGSTTVYFKINPADKSISKVTAGKKSMTVKWKKPSSTYRKQMTGYQIRYSTSSKMTSAKTVTIKSTTATNKTIKKLKAKKYYYVQLRTYKTVNNVKYYSGWSKTKRVKIK